MKTWVYRFFSLTSFLAGIVLLLCFEPLSEKIEVTNANVTPLLEQLSERQAEYAERMLYSLKVQTMEMWIVLRVADVWLFIGAIVTWWLSWQSGKKQSANI